MTTRLLFILALFACSELSHAQPYIGARIQHTTQKPNGTGHNCDYPFYVSCSHDLNTLNLYAGYAVGRVSVEVGAGPLGQRTAHNVGPQFDITQAIKTRHVYAAGIYRLGYFHALAGLSRVTMTNHEFGSNIVGPNQELSETTTKTRPILGLGASYPMGKFTLRADAFRIDRIAQSPHTGTSNVQGLSLGIERRF